MCGGSCWYRVAYCHRQPISRLTGLVGLVSGVVSVYKFPEQFYNFAVLCSNVECAVFDVWESISQVRICVGWEEGDVGILLL